MFFLWNYQFLRLEFDAAAADVVVVVAVAEDCIVDVADPFIGEEDHILTHKLL